jgi:hypothetical protein
MTKPVAAEPNRRMAVAFVLTGVGERWIWPVGGTIFANFSNLSGADARLVS